MTDDARQDTAMPQDIDELLREIREEQQAFDVFLEGYKLGVENQHEQPAVLEDKEAFRRHIRMEFRERLENVRER